jgi:hypothetical protein
MIYDEASLAMRPVATERLKSALLMQFFGDADLQKLGNRLLCAETLNAPKDARQAGSTHRHSRAGGKPVSAEQ